MDKEELKNTRKRNRNKDNPSRKRRNEARAKQYRQKLLQKEGKDIGLQTEVLLDCMEGYITPDSDEEYGNDVLTCKHIMYQAKTEEESLQQRPASKGLFKFLKKKTTKKRVQWDNKVEIPPWRDVEEGTVKVNPLFEESDSDDHHEEGMDPTPVYDEFELMLKLSRLEERDTHLAALRHLVRKVHENGEKITFPIPDAVDRMDLRTKNLPTETTELKRLMEAAYNRRGETFDIDEVYKDFVLSYGRIAFDASQAFPHCYVHIRHDKLFSTAKREQEPKVVTKVVYKSVDNRFIQRPQERRTQAACSYKTRRSMTPVLYLSKPNTPKLQCRKGVVIRKTKGLPERSAFSRRQEFKDGYWEESAYIKGLKFWKDTQKDKNTNG